MNKKILGSVVFVLMAMLVIACIPNSEKKGAAVADTNVNSDKGIQFVESNWAKALQEAKKQNKLIFLDAYTTWCGPCRMLKKNTFPNEAAGEFFNTNFINIALDMEKGDGLAVAEKYGVNAYPTLIVADGDGNVVTYTKGYVDAGQLIEFGKFALSKKQ